MDNQKKYKARPFLKWAGSKSKIVDSILQHLPPGKRLIEPFVGSGAIFLNSDFPVYYLGDINSDLINLYLHLQKEKENFINYCQQYFSARYNNKEAYGKLREKFNSTKNLRQKAALFLYLNRHGFNGLCRYNNKGIYNVPFGYYESPYFPSKEMIFFIQKTQQVHFEANDFQTLMLKAKPGDVIYCDPPYVPLSKTACFNKYSSQPFAQTEQLRLVELAKELAKKNIIVVISNHETEFTKKIYQDASIFQISVKRFIASKSENRQYVNELIAIYGSLPTLPTYIHLDEALG